MMKQFVYDTANVNRPYAVIGIVHIRNGCCSGEPVLITANKCELWESGINYSCQCGCGGWCTNGHEMPWEALKEYEEMTARSFRARKECE